jgi:hypothetical protein
MLGQGRASQYAGWWSGGNPAVVFSTTSDLAYTNRQTPSFSLLTGVGGSPPGSWGVASSGSFDLSGYSSLSGFNNNRSTQVATVYIDWPITGIASGAFVGYTQFNEMKQDNNTFYYNAQWQLTNSNTQFQVGGGLPGGNNFVLPGGYAQYMGRWLTFVWTASETQSSFTNWGATGGSGQYMRVAVFDTQSGALLGKLDYRYSGPLAQWSTWPTTVSTNNFEGDYGASIGGFGSGSDSNFYNTRISNLWMSYGTMFDPLTTTDTTWRTTRPSATIGTGKAWLNLQMTNFVVDDIPQYVITDSGMGLFSNSNNAVVKSNYNSGGNYNADLWALVQSTTITTKDSG